MKRFLLILILVAGLAAPATATANYSLITSDGGTTLVLGAGNEPAVAVTYSVVCAGTCATIISSANGVTGITDGAGCSGSGVTVTCDPAPQRVRVNGTGAEDLVTGACTGATVRGREGRRAG